MSINNELFKNKREQLYSKIANFWHNIYNSEYALYDIYTISKEDVTEISSATEKVGRIYSKTAYLLRTLDDETLLSLGFPKETLDIIRLKTVKPESVIARLDFVQTNEGLKLLELNSDTPTFIMECFKVNGLVTKEFNLNDPNSKSENHLRNAIHLAIKESSEILQLDYFPNIVFTAHHDHAEDWNTLNYLKEVTNLPSQLLPLNELQIDSDALYDKDGKKIDILYRQTYPLEHLINDKDQDDVKVGLMLLNLVKENKLAIINPPSAFLLQSKAVQAAIWSLYEQGMFFNQEEQGWIKKYFLPTYLEPDYFIENKQTFVKKPSFGREGDTIQIFDLNGQILDEATEKNYSDELPVYQQYVDLPKVTIRTEVGHTDSHFIIGSFLIAGKPSAIGIRAGNRITGNESYYLPVGINSN